MDKVHNYIMYKVHYVQGSKFKITIINMSKELKEDYE